jgi:hypothetical protein
MTSPGVRDGGGGGGLCACGGRGEEFVVVVWVWTWSVSVHRSDQTTTDRSREVVSTIRDEDNPSVPSRPTSSSPSSSPSAPSDKGGTTTKVEEVTLSAWTLGHITWTSPCGRPAPSLSPFSSSPFFSIFPTRAATLTCPARSPTNTTFAPGPTARHRTPPTAW